MRPCHHWGLSCVGLSARGSHVDGRLRPGAGTGPAGSGCPPPTCAVMRSCRPHPWACWGHRNQLWGGAGLRAAVTGSDSVPWGKLLLTGAALGAGSHVQSPRPSEDLAGADVPSAHECEDTGLVTSVRWPSVLGPAVWGGVLGGGGEVSHQRFRAEAAGLLEGLGERLPPQPACGHHARSAWAAQAYGHHARSAWAAQASWGNRPTEGPPRPR